MLVTPYRCNFQVQLQPFETSHSIDFEAYFRQELAGLQPFVQAGLLHRDTQSLTVSALARFFIRNICMVFDRYLRERRELVSYSKAV